MTVQAVFLIDTDVDEDILSNTARMSKAICLTCFRLLHFLSSIFEKRGTANKSILSHSAVKWGYKFFHSRTFKTKMESHKLYDMKLKYIEEFERVLSKRLKTNPELSKSSRTHKPSSCLGKALTETLADYQWEKPDLMSPVKRRKQNTKETPLNFVFLFMKCPKNSKALKIFTGKQVPDEDVFLDSFLSPDLFQQFCSVSKLLLNWIDTQPLTTIPADMESCDATSLRIVEQAMSKARGKVFPLDLIVQRGSPFMVNIWNHLESPTPENNSEISKECYESIPFLPLSSVLGFLLSTYPGVDGGQARNKNASISVGEEVMDVIVTPATKDEGSGRYKMRKDASRIDAADLSQLSSTSLASYQPAAPTSMSAYALLDVDIARLNIQADSQYMCTAKIGGSESRFECMVSALTRQGCSLVLIDDVTGHLVILHPLTLQSCSLAPLTKGASLHVEKVLLSQKSDRVNALEQEAGSPNDLVQRLVRNSASVATGARGTEAVGRFDGRVMDRWYIPGPKTSLNSLLDKLSSRIEHMDFLSADEAEMLRELRKVYKQQTTPPGLRDTSIVMKTEQPVPVPLEEKSAGDLAVSDAGGQGKTSRGSISRADRILNKSKAVVKERVQTETERKEERPDRRDRVKVDVTALSADFKNVEELQSYLTSCYERLVGGETTDINTAVQTMVAVSLHYVKQSSDSDPQGQCKALLEERVVVSGVGLREKYQNAIDVAVQESKIAEYQVQVILRLEIHSSLVNSDQSMEEADCNMNNEIVSLLRTLSFIMEPGQLSKFMQSCLVFNYMDTIPHTLAYIYDELMQPLPQSLAVLLSPGSSSVDQSVLNSSLIGGEMTGGGPPSARTRSHGSVGPPSSQPGSNNGGTQDLSTSKRRKLVHHPSLSDFGAKRQIVVEKAPKQKKVKSTRKRKDSYKRSKDKVTKSLFGVKKGGTKLERRRSVAVMERAATTPSKSRPKPFITSPRTRLQSPRRCKVVAETPRHKQVSQSVRRRMMEPRDQITNQTEVNNTHVVEESPEKPCAAVLKDTPTKDKRAKALLRRSFYSAGPVKRTRNLTQYYQLADRIAGRQRRISGTVANKPARLLSFDAKLTSPNKNSSFLASQLAPSPSPAKLTPRKSTSTVDNGVPSSPILNTRSKLALFKSPDRLLSNPRSSITSPRVHRSPFSRRQSLPVFVPDSETKNSHMSPKKTPGKNTVCGKVTFGLDSPSHVTKPKVTSTPTRKSVRAALFASSPRAGRYQSPRRLANSPGRLLVQQESSEKHSAAANDENRVQSAQNCTSPISHKNRDKGGLNVTPSRRKLKLADTEIQTASNHDNCKKKTLTENSKCPTEKNERLPSVDSLQLSRNTDRQRTPSPHGDSTVKTPDSFDKWRRRKPRSAQKFSYPSSSSSDSGENAEANAKVTPPKTSGNHEKLILKACNRNTANKSRDFKSASKKRSLISMESLTDSPCKKRKSEIETQSDFSSVLKHDDSMGFDVTGSFSEMSQQSAASSLDYFSASNEEVFLSQESKSVLWPSDSGEIVEKSESRKQFIQSLPPKKYPSNMFTAKITKEDIPLKEGERSDSPVFGSGKKSAKAKTAVEETAAGTVRKRAPSGSQASSSSPRIVKSPDGRTYSPVVSVKSLMHLIQSPLVRSPGKGSTLEPESPRRRVKHVTPTQKTRRSLNLQN